MILFLGYSSLVSEWVAHCNEGDEPVYDSETGLVSAGKKHASLAVCYLRHAFALGEHYNSVVPAEGEDADRGAGNDSDFQQVTSSS